MAVSPALVANANTFDRRRRYDRHRLRLHRRARLPLPARPHERQGVARTSAAERAEFDHPQGQPAPRPHVRPRPRRQARAPLMLEVGDRDPARRPSGSARASSTRSRRSSPTGRSSCSSTSSTGPGRERTRWSSCVTGARSSRQRASGRSGSRATRRGRTSPGCRRSTSRSGCSRTGTARPFAASASSQDYRGMQDVRAADGVPDRPGREGTRSVELRERARTGLRRAAGRRPGFVALAVRRSTSARRWSRPSRRSCTPGRSFLAGGAPGHGEAAPGDHLQTGYRLWLAGPPARARPRALGRPVLVPARGRAAGEPGVVALRAPVLAARPRASARCSPGTCSRCSASSAPARSRLLWLRELGLSRFAAAGRRARLRDRARTGSMQSRGHLLGPISLLLPLALWAFERAPANRRPALVVALARGARLDPALGPGAPRARRDPLLRRSTRSAARASTARWPGDGGSASPPRCSPACCIRLTVIAGSIDEGGRSLKEVDRLLRRRARLRLRHVAARGGELRLPRLADAARSRSAASSLLVRGGDAGSRPCSGSARSCRSLLALGTTTRSTARSGTPSPRFATRASRSG